MHPVTSREDSGNGEYQFGVLSTIRNIGGGGVRDDPLATQPL